MNLGQIVAGRNDGRAMRIGATASTLFRGLSAVPGEAESFIRRVQERDPGGRADQATAHKVAAQVIRSLLIPICRQEDWLTRGALHDVEVALEAGDRDKIASETAACAAISQKLWTHCEKPGPRDWLACQALLIAAQANETGLSEFLATVGRCAVAAARVQRTVSDTEAGQLQHRAYSRAASFYIDALQHRSARHDRATASQSAMATDDSVEAPSPA